MFTILRAQKCRLPYSSHMVTLPEGHGSSLGLGVCLMKPARGSKGSCQLLQELPPPARGTVTGWEH